MCEKEIIKLNKRHYKKVVKEYVDATNIIGLWKSEEYTFKKYFDRKESILDIGCGTGRTTFGLYSLGYKNIIGLDISEIMLKKARKIREKLGFNIEFIKGDILDIEFDKNRFNNALFSFNGLMQIPKKENRIKALEETKRILKPSGTLIFTTHDRDRGKKFKDFWRREKEKWEKNLNDKRLYEYGDRITTLKDNDQELFIHIPDRGEVLDSIKKAGFLLIEDFFRSDRFNESKNVKKFSGECRFWIVKNKD